MSKDTKKYLLTDFYGEDYYLVPIMTTYHNNGRLAILLYDEDDEVFCDMTVNIPNGKLSGTKNAFIDTNNSPWLVSFIKKHQLARPTGQYAMSGYCLYPEYEFDLSKLNSDNQ